LALLLHFYIHNSLCHGVYTAMRTAIVLMMLSCLTATTGCSVSGQAITRHSSAPLSSDPSYTPPGQMNLAIGESNRGSGSSAKTTAEAMPQPNKQQVQKHSIRAAMY
jgi:hypothetical protein